MSRLSALATAISMSLLPVLAEAQTVNADSRDYKMGQVVGAVFGAIIVFVVIRKVMSSNK